MPNPENFLIYIFSQEKGIKKGFAVSIYGPNGTTTFADKDFIVTHTTVVLNPIFTVAEQKTMNALTSNPFSAKLSGSITKFSPPF